jgi:hypothetical protein
MQVSENYVRQVIRDFNDEGLRHWTKTERGQAEQDRSGDA